MKIALLTIDNREHGKDYGNPTPWFGTAPEALLQGFSMLPKDAEIHVISCVRKPMASPAKLADNIWFHPLLVPKIGWLSTAYQGCIRAVRRKIREINPDIVHGQGTERECAISAVFSGKPNVLTIHGNMRLIAKLHQVRPFTYPWLVAHLESLTIPRSQGVVCITHYTEDAVRDLARRTWVLPNAVDAGFFDVVNKPTGIPQLLVVGFICERKNQNAFIRALDSLSKRRDFRILFLGNANKNSPYGAEFFDLIQSRPWCEWGGFADRAGLRAHFANAHGLVLPSLEDNCPMVVLEAMAAGVPVVAPNVGGVPDLISNGVNGVLCDPTLPESISQSVERLLDDIPSTRQMAGTAHDLAITRYHPKIIAEQHLGIYREVLGRLA